MSHAMVHYSIRTRFAPDTHIGFSRSRGIRYFQSLKMSNTFDGVIREFPFIGIDRFNTTASVFLLTHSHADHLSGISNKSFTGIVYCSNETKKLLALDKRLHGSMKLVKGLFFNKKTRIESPSDASHAYYVTLIDAYHCLGACMFLIEEVSYSSVESQNCESSYFDNSLVTRAVLCTGDLRAEQWWCESIRLSPPLFPYTTGDRILDCIYFDSTFAYRSEPYIEIPPNNQGIHTAISILRKYPKNDPEIEFGFCDATLGFEQAWAFILSYFGGSLRIENVFLKEKIRLVAEHDRVNGKILGQAISDKFTSKRPVFHGELPSTEKTFFVRIKQCINFNIRDFTGSCYPTPLKNISSHESLQLVYTTKFGNTIYEYLDRKWILPSGGDELLPFDVKLMFSRHSSYSEVRSFLSMFEPRQVFPCFYSHKVWQSGFTMARVFGDLCASKEFNYDKMMTADYGTPSSDIVDRPVVTINRWNVDDCQEEEKFVEEILKKTDHLKKTSEAKLALLELRKVARVPVRSERAAADWAFLRKRNKDFSLQKIVEGRQSSKYEKFVQEQQMLYYKKHNLPQYKRDYQSPKYSREFSSALGGTSDYDTDSCGSSLDLAERSRKENISSRSFREISFMRESQQGLFWKVHKVATTSQRFSRRSFIESSFGSYEESQSPSKASKCNSRGVLYMSEGEISPQNIDNMSTKLASVPSAWNDLQLSCTV